MDKKNWPLTSRAVEESERAAGPNEADLTDDTEPEQGNSLLQELAIEGLVEELSPGRYWVSDRRPDLDKLS